MTYFHENQSQELKSCPRRLQCALLTFFEISPEKYGPLMSIKQFLHDNIHTAMIAADIPDEFLPQITLSTKTEFGDFQANGALGAAKRLKTNPRKLAQKILGHIKLDGVAEKIEIAGPGFLNIHLEKSFLAHKLNEIKDDSRLGVPSVATPQNVVFDYSSPNLAKEMHVGHLRSTIIGDAVVRAVEFTGHNVIRQNHMGDWGTQFGMLIAELEEQTREGEIALKDLEVFYQQSKKHFDDDPDFATKARNYVVKLQSGDEHCLTLWKQFIDISVAHSEEIYKALNVSLTHDNIMPESAYNDALAGVICTLEDKDLAVDDQGAKVVFLQELADKKGNPSPMIVQKSDGGYLYATTDLAALDYRCHTLDADRILIFIDTRQTLHMKQVYTAGLKAGFATDKVSFEHHPFGTMMGADGKPFKTRTGGTVKLADLLTEAVERAGKLIAEKDPDLTEQERADVAHKVGIGAVKYADLSKTRTNDYIFNWESMLSFEGNTAPYLQYAYARIRSIFRKADVQSEQLTGDIVITETHEKALAMKLLQFGEVVEQIVNDAYPHVLCNYLYDLASLYMSFYEHCPVLKDGVAESARSSRLQLSKLTSQTIAKGLDLLGIEVMEKM
jgi:arginyl-tRNA synthetase